MPGLGVGGGGFFIWGYYLAIYLGVAFYIGVPYWALLAPIGPYWEALIPKLLSQTIPRR